MKIATNTTWHVEKDGVSIQLTPEDVCHLLEQVLWSDYLLVFDWRSKRLGSGPDEINVSLNGSAIQVTLFDDEDGTPEQEQDRSQDGPQSPQAGDNPVESVTALGRDEGTSEKREGKCQP